MKKIVNLRPILLLFLSAICGIFTAGAALRMQNLLLAYFILAIFFILILITISTYFLKHRLLEFFSRAKTLIFATFIVFILGGVSLFIAIKNFEGVKLEGGTYLVQGTLTEYINPIDNGVSLYLTKVIAHKDGEEFKLSKKLRLNIFSSEELEESSLKAGTKIFFETSVFDYELIQNGQFNTFVYNNKLGYYASVSAIDVILVEGNMPLDATIRQNIRGLLHKYMSYDGANIAYASLFGDTTLLSSKIYDSFVDSGIVHILSVSGLHISFLVLMILFFFNKIKLNKKLSFVLLMVILALYSYMCGFAPSVLRSSAMALILLFAKLIGEQNDNLSTLSLSGLLILLVSPMNLYSAGFLLSFSSVFAIFTLYPPLSSFFKRLKFPSWMGASTSLTVSAQIGTLPIIASMFGQVNTLSILTNIIAVPLFTVGYLFLFINIFLAAILPIFGFLFTVPSLMFNLVYIISKLISTLSFGVIYLFGLGLFATLLFYILIFVVSRFVMLRPKAKVASSMILVFIISLSVIFSTLPANFNKFSFRIIAGVDNATVLTTPQNQAYLIDIGQGDRWDVRQIDEFLVKSKIKTLEGLIITNYTQEKQQAVIQIATNYKVKKLLIPSVEDNALIFGLAYYKPSYLEVIMLKNEVPFAVDGLIITSYVHSARSVATKINNDTFSALFFNHQLTAAQFNKASTLIEDNTDILILNGLNLSRYDILLQNDNFSNLKYVFATRNSLDLLPEGIYDVNAYNIPIVLDLEAQGIKLKI